jgi:hypothetical protein
MLAGPAPVPDPNRKIYFAVNSTVGGGAIVATNELGKTVVSHLQDSDSYCQFDQVDGDKGGRAAIYIRYATAERLAKLRLTVNDEDHSLLNAPSTGSPSDFTGLASITVPLKPGNDNTIRFTGDIGEISLESLAVSPF